MTNKTNRHQNDIFKRSVLKDELKFESRQFKTLHNSSDATLLNIELWSKWKG